jgi:hypothetical protein
MIIISDGDPTPPTASTIKALIDANATVSTVAVGSHGILGSSLMQRIATRTGGKYYVVNNANTLPKIYQREARRIARPLVYEPKPTVSPDVVMQHEMLQGLEGGFPEVSGFVLTSVKESPLVEVILRSPSPSTAENATILAAWTYGLGKAAVFTTDTGRRWATDWTNWDGYDSFFSQMVRWSMRPSGDTGKFSVATDVQGTKTRVVITAIDKDDEYLNYQTLTGSVLGPNMETIPLAIDQTAPGRYVGEFDSPAAGSYMIRIMPGAGEGMIRTGVNVGYSDEFRDQETDLPLLESLAGLTAKDGAPGKMIDPLPGVPPNAENPDFDAQLAVDPYRRDMPLAISSQDIWPWLVLVGSCLFLADVFVRRVQISLEWLAPAWQRFSEVVFRRERQLAPVETMSRLRSRKAEVGQALDSRRAAARFEPDPTLPVDTTATEATEAKTPATTPTDKPSGSQQLAADQPAEESYTARLLKAKKQVWNKKDEER